MNCAFRLLATTARGLLAALAFGLAASAALAQAPDRPIRIVLGFAAGGGSDVVLRSIAQRLAVQLGQPVIVDNKPGADGIIAAEFAAKAAPDGNTLYFGSGQPLVAVPLLRGRQAIPYDPFKDFTPIANLGRFSMFMVVPSSMPVNNVREFISYVKARPGKLNYASSFTVARMAAIQTFSQAQLDMLHVPYKGDAPALTDLMADRVHMMFTTGAAVRGFVKEGRVRALVTLRDTRSPQLPDVPTAKEAGLRISVSPWSGLYGPAGMPAAAVERINAALRAALASKEAHDQLEQLGFEPAISSPAEMAAIHRGEYEVFQKALADGIKFD